MRIVRLIRLVKLFKHWDGQHVSEGVAQTGSSRLSRFPPLVKQSHVGQKLSELTTRRVVLGVLTMVLILPFMEIVSPIYGHEPRASDTDLRTLHSLALQDKSSPLFTSSLQVCISACVYWTSGMDAFRAYVETRDLS
jgi:hypothetical protein